ncbi:MAG: 50S ribosomal protein P1 [Thermoplasmata archaeon]|nr:MAG: 50S ribosomal protein P1 [Thermoplasmata archaeon]
MEYIYSAMLLHAAGKEITEQGISKVLQAAGVKPDEARVKALTASLEGVNIEEAMATPAQIAAVAAPAPATGEPPAKEEKKGEKKEEKKEKEEASEEDAAAGLGALFG